MDFFSDSRRETDTFGTLLFLSIFLVLTAGNVRAQAKAIFRSSLTDRNNSKDTAQIVSTDKIIEGHIYPRKDHDFYMITLPSPGILRIRHSEIDSNMASAIKIHNEVTTEKRWQNGNRGQSQQVVHPIKEKGIYYIEVADTKDTNYSEKPYILEISFQEALDKSEPNDSMIRATPVKLPVTHAGKIFPPSDIDRFRFYVKDKGCLKIILTGMDHKAGSRIKVTDSTGKKVTGEGSTLFSPRAGGWIKETKPGYQKLLININERGSYIVSLGQNTDFISPLDYRIRIEFHEASKDKNEPNNSIREAKRIFPGETIEGYILPARDHDYYKIPLRGFGKLYAGVSNLKGELRPSINILSPSGNVSLTKGWVDKEEEISSASEVESENTAIGHEKTDSSIEKKFPQSNPESDRETHFVEVKIDKWGEYYILIGSSDAENASIDPYRLHCIFVNRQKGMPGYPRVEGRQHP